MNELQIFKNSDFGEIGVLVENGKELFPATESAKLLGYANPHKAIGDHCRKDGLTKREVIDRMGRKQVANFITEGNLYRLITHSQMPGAERFESWIFDEVIPSIRREGAYMTPETIETVLLNPDTIIALAQRLKATQAENKALAYSCEFPNFFTALQRVSCVYRNKNSDTRKENFQKYDTTC